MSLWELLTVGGAALGTFLYGWGKGWNDRQQVERERRKP